MAYGPAASPGRVGNAASLDPPPTYGVKVRILTRSPGNSSAPLVGEDGFGRLFLTFYLSKEVFW